MPSSSRACSSFPLSLQAFPLGCGSRARNLQGLPARALTSLWMRLVFLLWGLHAKMLQQLLPAWEAGKPEVDQFYFDLKREPSVFLSFSLERTELKMQVLGGSSILF